MSESILEKRKLLKEEILLQNINPQKFINYFESEKGANKSMKTCTVEELQQQIQAFKNQNPDEIEIKRKISKKEYTYYFGKSSGESESESESSSSEEEETKKKNQKKVEKKDDSSSSSSDDDQEKQNTLIEGELHMSEIPGEEKEDIKEDFEEKGDNDESKDKRKYKARKHVAKYTPTILVDQGEKLKVEVSNPEVIKKGLFKGSYTVYTIMTSPFEWFVKRRYNDFIWLYECLVKRFPANYVISYFYFLKDSDCSS